MIILRILYGKLDLSELSKLTELLISYEKFFKIKLQLPHQNSEKIPANLLVSGLRIMLLHFNTLFQRNIIPQTSMTLC